jgi:hypothetical protein
LTLALDAEGPLPATEQNRMLAAERLRRGRGLDRAADRKTWAEDISELPDGTVIVEGGAPLLVLGNALFEFDFAGWQMLQGRPQGGQVTVLTPPTSVAALRHGFTPRLHDSIAGSQ